MGMFDKDKKFAPDGQLDKWVSEETDFILVSAEVVDEEFDFGGEDTAIMSHLTVCSLDNPEKHYKVSSLGRAIAAKIKEQESGDLPAVVRWKMVETDMNDAMVIQFVRECSDDEKSRVLEVSPI